jgi:integrase/recombinase XerD
VKLRLKYLVEDVDRHGNVRAYVRIPGRRKVRIRGVPWSDEFMAQYQEAIAGRGEAPRQARAAQRGSFRYLCQRYYASGTF